MILEVKNIVCDECKTWIEYYKIKKTKLSHSRKVER